MTRLDSILYLIKESYVNVRKRKCLKFEDDKMCLSFRRVRCEMTLTKITATTTTATTFC